MKNAKKMTSILLILEKQRDHVLLHVTRLNQTIEKKKGLVTKMTLYLNDYSQQHVLIKGHCIPSLFLNFKRFLTQIENVISKTQQEIEHLETSKKSKMDDMLKINQKIHWFNALIKNIEIEAMKQHDAVEQMLLDDWSSTKKQRGNYD